MDTISIVAFVKNRTVFKKTKVVIAYCVLLIFRWFKLFHYHNAWKQQIYLKIVKFIIFN